MQWAGESPSGLIKLTNAIIYTTERGRFLRCGRVDKYYINTTTVQYVIYQPGALMTLWALIALIE